MACLFSLFLFISVASGVIGGSSSVGKKSQQLGVTHLRRSITHYRTKTWNWQDARSPVSWEFPSIRIRGSKRYLSSKSIPYLQYVEKRWKALAAEEWKIAKKYKEPYAAIHYVFGSYGDQAWRVALCEGGRPVPSVNAQNGQYLGMFQMGSGERSRYGHSHTPLGQSVAAYRYFVATGRDWSPWECRPYGHGW